MITAADPSSEGLKRIPGLFRRWELPEILKNQGAYSIENAGSHQDGTPLVAIYAEGEADQPDDLDNPSNKNVEAPSVPSGTIWRRPE